MTNPDKWRGRQMYPKDTVSQKKLDRVDDRSNRRIDLLKTKHHDLTARVGDLENEIRLLHKLLDAMAAMRRIEEE